MKITTVSRSRSRWESPGRWWALMAVVMSGLLTLAACGTPTATPAPATVQAAATTIAPTVAAARTAAGATVGAAQTQVAPTVAGAQTQVAATVPAAQTQVAPTVAAAQTAIIATIGPPIASTTAESPVQITAVQISTADTTIVVTNTSAGQADINAWILLLGTFPLVLPVSPYLRIQPGKAVTLHLSRATDTATDVYLGQAPELLVNSLKPGTRIALINLRGQVASLYLVP
jgi:hypothetical protein